uniref:Cellulose synthase-like protein H1 n=1 Tax=Tanacetum cinerariifolium TaxID=118510 RepID=A0A6L2JCW2_TANCI|nr:cellulose synthase-like protein H1 [Tanacetum cinerariifolium]
MFWLIKEHRITRKVIYSSSPNDTITENISYEDLHKIFGRLTELTDSAAQVLSGSNAKIDDQKTPSCFIEAAICVAGCRYEYGTSWGKELSVIGAAKVSHFEILCRVHGFEPTVGLFHCFYVKSKNKEMDLLSFIRTADPMKVRIGERQRDEDEPKLLETTVGRVVPLLLVAPDRSSGELEASVEKLFGEGGSGEQAKQGDFASGGHGVGIDVVVETSVEDVAFVQLKRQKKRKNKVADAGTSKASEPISSQGSSDGNNLSSISLYKHFIFNYKEQNSNDDDDNGRFTFDKSPMVVSGVTILLVNLTALVNGIVRLSGSANWIGALGLGEIFCSVCVIVCFWDYLKGLFKNGKYGIPFPTIWKSGALALLFVQLC